MFFRITHIIPTIHITSINNNDTSDEDTNTEENDLVIHTQIIPEYQVSFLKSDETTQHYLYHLQETISISKHKVVLVSDNGYYGPIFRKLTQNNSTFSIPYKDVRFIQDLSILVLSEC